VKTVNSSAPPINTRIGSVDRSGGPNAGSPADKSGGADFLGQLQALQNTSNAITPDTGVVRGSSLGITKPPELKFSNHAIDRMQARGIAFSPNQMARIQNAVDKAASKGAKNTLLLADDSALIVSVKDKTVVTVMDKTALKENVFTNIDSTVMI
jgi:flagellar operon protein